VASVGRDGGCAEGWQLRVPRVGMRCGRVRAAVALVAVLVAVLGYVEVSRAAPGASAEERAQFGAWVRGAELLRQTGEAVRAKHGFRVIHQSWSSERLRGGQMARCFASWGRAHPGALHVLWTDEDNLRLVREHYPEWAVLYEAMPMGIMRADMVRLLYVHRYGGV
jgi:hypothetical protein